MKQYTAEDFNIKNLGSFYYQDKTIFRVFAPENEQIFLVINDHEYPMHKNNLCFEIALGGNLEKVKYHYKNENGIGFLDPFAYCAMDNESIVLDTKKFLNTRIKPSNIDNLFIYEANVRDFSSKDSYIGKFNKKFISLAETGLKKDDYFVMGLDYLCNLGINCIQLMPVLDFDKDNSDYNWGYNPIAYNYVNSDYVYEYSNPYAYVNELRYVVNKLHSKDIRVTLDVVFNHVYNVKTNDLVKMLYGHAIRFKQDGTLANGTMCGNEINSQDPFIREYIVEMSRRYIELFDIDGIRLDLMGILDVDTVNEIYEECHKLKDDFILYGEGWNMGDVLPENIRASKNNADKISNVSMFNDYARDTITNFVCNNTEINNEMFSILSADNVLKGKQSINYVECHDGYTFLDHLLVYKDEGQFINTKRCKLALALVMLAKGIPFIHMGQEFLRTKNKIRDSYNSPDDINGIDWNRRIEYNQICDYFKDLIKLRKLIDVNNVQAEFADYYGCILYKLGDYTIIINNREYDYYFNDGKEYDVIFDENGSCNYKSRCTTIPSFGLIVCKL